jgi:hypothetical protein
MSQSPTPQSPEKLGEGSRKSSLNAFSTPPVKEDKESDEDGYVTAEDEDEEATLAVDKTQERPIEGPGHSRTLETATPPGSAPMDTSASSGIRGLMGRIRL